MTSAYTHSKLFVLFLLLSISGFASAQQSALRLTWILSGPAIDGVAPSGKAVLRQPSLPGELRVDIKDVNLPDGTMLSMWMGNFFAGTLVLDGGKARLETELPFQFRNGFVEFRLGDTVIMSGRFKN
ncbi:MAG TPA: hypothetical protein VJ835_04455 [Fimbriimonadaceae bacterium]|nr:hypothetical protein [Fimbriimonadaceae bacterium]